MSLSIKIFGAGVGGLTTAHRLIHSMPKNLNFKVDIYEMKNTAGGLARTEGGECDTKEISWRVYFHFYKYLFNIMKDIPSAQNPHKSVLDHLVPYENIFVPKNTIKNKFHTYFKILRLLMMSSERLESYDDVAWIDYIKDGLSDIPQWLGMDKYKGSTTSVENIGIEQSVIAKKIGRHQDYVLDGPTNHVWIDPWVEYLKSKGVNFHFNSTVTEISTTPGNHIRAVKVNGESLTADIYVLSLPIEMLSYLLPQIPDLTSLAKQAYQIQLAFQMFLEKPLSFGIAKNGSPVLSVLLHDSPWSLIIEAKNISWANGDSNKNCKEYQWSATVCQSNVPGISIGKTFLESGFPEIQREILAQINSNADFIDLLKHENPTFDGNIRVVRWSTMDNTYHLKSRESPILTTSEPKFSNNIGTKKLRPSIRLGSNVYVATAYSKETIDIFSMEAATISGEKVATSIIARYNRDGRSRDDSSDRSRDITLPSRPVKALAGFRLIDKLLFKLGLPDVGVVIIIILLVIAALYIFKRIRVK